jgi:alanine-glyoxylate transaminase/serine-glyoxylate transaminase/serine-pyruvate transaminase
MLNVIFQSIINFLVVLFSYHFSDQTKVHLMTNLLDQIQEVLLMGPGPSCVHPDVYKALAKPTLGHMDTYFIRIMDELQVMLQKLMNTKNRMNLPISGTGSAGMEACFVNLVERGDQVLILQNGVFGQRMQDVDTRLGAIVDVLEYKWGNPVLVNEVREKFKSKKY